MKTIYLLLFLSLTATAKMPHLSDDKYYEYKKMSIDRAPCDRSENCLTIDLTLGKGIRNQVIKRLQKLAVHRGLFVRVISETKGHPVSRIRLQLAGEYKALALLEKKIQREAIR